MKRMLYLCFSLFATSVLLLSCGPSGNMSEEAENETAQQEKGTIEKMRKRAAQKGVDYIKKPIDKAKNIEEKARRRVEDLNNMGK